jgi:homoserine O-acetyltransferase
MSFPTQTGSFDLGDILLQSGETLAGAKLAWKTYGTLSPNRDNLVLYPTCYTSTHNSQEWLIAPDGILDPDRYFVVTPDMFGNGLSSSPSNHPNYPKLVTSTDNVRAQKRFLTEQFGIEKLACVYGWAALFPALVDRAIVVCGTAQTSPHNKVFLEGLLAILEAAPEHLGDGRFSSEPYAALRAFARVYAGWCMSQDFYRANLHLATAASLTDFLDREWEPGFTAHAAADLYAQARTWYAGDISANELYDNDLPAALTAITAKILLMPGDTDLYFRVADNDTELTFLQHAALKPIPRIWGHAAGAPDGLAAELAFQKAAVREWLDV